MNYKMMSRFEAWILAVEAAFMVPAFLISLFSDADKATLAFAISIGILAVSAGLFALSSILILLIVGLLETSYIVLTLICLGIVALFMHTACSVMTSIAPLELREKMDSGVLAGVLNGFCYVGSIISSYGLGIIADNFGWTSVFYFLFVLAIVPSVVLLARCGIKITKRTLKTK